MWTVATGKAESLARDEALRYSSGNGNFLADYSEGGERVGRPAGEGGGTYSCRWAPVVRR